MRRRKSYENNSALGLSAGSGMEWADFLNYWEEGKWGREDIGAGHLVEKEFEVRRLRSLEAFHIYLITWSIINSSRGRATACSYFLGSCAVSDDLDRFMQAIHLPLLLTEQYALIPLYQPPQTLPHSDNQHPTPLSPSPLCP